MQSPDEQTLAWVASKQSIEYATSKQKDGWLNLFSPDAQLHDPVGCSPLDLNGQGHCGHDAIARFWDSIIQPADLSIDVILRILSGEHACAVHQVVSHTLADNQVSQVPMIVTYDVNHQGLITLLRAFWNFSAMMRSMNHG